MTQHSVSNLQCNKLGWGPGSLGIVVSTGRPATVPEMRTVPAFQVEFPKDGTFGIDVLVNSRVRWQLLHFAEAPALRLRFNLHANRGCAYT